MGFDRAIVEEAVQVCKGSDGGAEANRQDDFEITESKNTNDVGTVINKKNTFENGPGSVCISQVLQMGFDRAIVEEAVQVCKGSEGEIFFTVSQN